MTADLTPWQRAPLRVFAFAGLISGVLAGVWRLNWPMPAFVAGERLELTRLMRTAPSMTCVFTAIMALLGGANALFLLLQFSRVAGAQRSTG